MNNQDNVPIPNIAGKELLKLLQSKGIYLTLEETDTLFRHTEDYNTPTNEETNTYPLIE